MKREIEKKIPTFFVIIYQLKKQDNNNNDYKKVIKKQIIVLESCFSNLATGQKINHVLKIIAIP